MQKYMVAVKIMTMWWGGGKDELPYGSIVSNKETIVHQ
jgi:hypothetical protein